MDTSLSELRDAWTYHTTSIIGTDTRYYTISLGVSGTNTYYSSPRYLKDSQCVSIHLVDIIALMATHGYHVCTGCIPSTGVSSLSTLSYCITHQICSTSLLVNRSCWTYHMVSLYLAVYHPMHRSTRPTSPLPPYPIISHACTCTILVHAHHEILGHRMVWRCYTITCMGSGTHLYH